MLTFESTLKQINQIMYVVVDFETVTPSGRPPEPIELGAMLINTNLSLDTRSCFTSLMQLPNGIQLTNFDTYQTGILQKEVDNAETAKAVFQKFEDYLPKTDHIFIAQNANYEASIFSRYRDMCPKSASANFVDTVKLAKFLIPNIKDYKLDTLARYFDVPIAIDRHRALPDVEMTVKIFIRLIEVGLQNRKFMKVADLMKIGGIPVKQDDSQQSLF